MIRQSPSMSAYVLSCPVQSFLDSIRQVDIDGRDTRLKSINALTMCCPFICCPLIAVLLFAYMCYGGFI